jgi:hypothetical protein
MPWGEELGPEIVRRIARSLRNRAYPRRQNYNGSPYRGHFAVTRSVVEGFKKIGGSFNYNPLHAKRLGENLIVLSGVRTLRQAIRLKQQGRIRTLYAGPNVVIFSTDHDSLLASPEIDGVITPSDWVTDLYVSDTPSLRSRCFAWPAGVDTAYWQPDSGTRRDGILIYEKQDAGPVGPTQPYAAYLRNLGWRVDVLPYGTFTHEQYREMLGRSCLMLGFVTGESQGIAWAEAWCMDVPTLIWKNESNVYRGRQYRCSTAPYLRRENGLFFEDLSDFKRQFTYWQIHREQFNPRDWILKNMSDEACASILYKKVTEC